MNAKAYLIITMNAKALQIIIINTKAQLITIINANLEMVLQPIELPNHWHDAITEEEVVFG